MNIGEGLTKTFSIPISHLDFKYIDDCSNIKELEKIYLTLKLGEEGCYPDLLKHCEDKLKLLSPDNRVLRKAEEIKNTKDLDKVEREKITSEFSSFLKDMEKIEVELNAYGDSETKQNKYPVRSGSNILVNEKNETVKVKKSCKPRGYDEWSKIADELEKEILVEEEEEKKPTAKPKFDEKKESEAIQNKIFKGLSCRIDTSNMSKVEKEKLAVLEKEKGNEAFKSGDLSEALAYYCRSLSISSSPAVYNNRGLIYMKQKKWKEAVKDFNIALKNEHDNIKALQRRASCLYEMGNLPDCINDCRKILRNTPDSKITKDLLTKAEGELQERSKPKLEGGKRMVITEVDSEEDNSDEEESTTNNVTTEVGATISIDDQMTKENVNKEAEVDFDKIKEKGNEYYKKMDYEAALATYDQLVQHFPDNPIGYRNRATCNLMLNKPHLVIEDCNKAISLDNKSHLAFYRRGKANKMLNKFSESVTDLEEAVRLAPDMKQIQDELKEAKTCLIESRNDEKIEPVKETISERQSPDSTSWEFVEQTNITADSEPNNNCVSNDSVETLYPDCATTVTKFEFEKQLSKIRHMKVENWRLVVQLLVNIGVNNITSMMTNKLDGFVLETIISSLLIYLKNEKHATFVKNILKSLTMVDRFNFIKFMISDNAIFELNEIFSTLYRILKNEKAELLQLERNFK